MDMYIEVGSEEHHIWLWEPQLRGTPRKKRWLPGGKWLPQSRKGMKRIESNPVVPHLLILCFLITYRSVIETFG